jgi:hypothetical protein
MEMIVTASKDSKKFEWSRFRSDSWTAQNVGDQIAGTVTDLQVREGRNGDVPVLTLLCDDGSTTDVWCGAAQLRSQVAAIEPDIGTWLVIKFIGEQHVGQPSPMKVFEVTTPPAPPNAPF